MKKIMNMLFLVAMLMSATTAFADTQTIHQVSEGLMYLNAIAEDILANSEVKQQLIVETKNKIRVQAENIAAVLVEASSTNTPQSILESIQHATQSGTGLKGYMADNSLILKNADCIGKIEFDEVSNNVIVTLAAPKLGICEKVKRGYKAQHTEFNGKLLTIKAKLSEQAANLATMYADWIRVNTPKFALELCLKDAKKDGSEGYITGNMLTVRNEGFTEKIEFNESTNIVSVAIIVPKLDIRVEAQKDCSQQLVEFRQKRDEQEKVTKARIEEQATVFAKYISENGVPKGLELFSETIKDAGWTADITHNTVTGKKDGLPYQIQISVDEPTKTLTLIQTDAQFGICVKVTKSI